MSDDWSQKSSDEKSNAQIGRPGLCACFSKVPMTPQKASKQLSEHLINIISHHLHAPCSNLFIL